jgi:hypothetical protein
MTARDDIDESDAGEELADRVVSQVRRRRTRRRVVTVAAVAAVVAVALLFHSGGGGAPAASGGSDAVHTTRSAPSVSERAQIYVAALSRNLHPGVARVPIYVHIHVCRSVASAPAGCDDGGIPVDVQREVTAMLGDAVRFIPQAPNPQGVEDPAVITFGELAVAGDHATLGMQTLCGPLCGQGQTLVLAKAQGTWRVTGTTGPEWIS